MITKTFTATIGVGAGTAYIRPALLEEERRAGAQDWPHGPSAHCPLSSRETCRASCINMVIAVSLLYVPLVYYNSPIGVSFAGIIKSHYFL